MAVNGRVVAAVSQTDTRGQWALVFDAGKARRSQFDELLSDRRRILPARRDRLPRSSRLEIIVGG